MFWQHRLNSNIVSRQLTELFQYRMLLNFPYFCLLLTIIQIVRV